MPAFSPLIITKILLPKKPLDLLRRPRLTDFLHANVEHKLILISAPAGYGKTSLLIDFAHDTDLTVCWYSLDQFDRDPSIFLDHLIATIQQAYPQFGTTAPALLHGTADLRRNMYPLVATLVNEIYEKIPEYFILILDDYHFLDDQDEINEFMAHFLRNVAENCHVIISTRTLPAIPNLAWLAAGEQVVGLGINELRFTPQEIQALIKQNYNLDMPEEKAEQLSQYSEGWITAILLAAHTMWEKLLEDVVRVKEADVYDYLTEQVFTQQPPHVQDFLTVSSALDEMSPALCDELLGIHDSVQMLALIQRRNLFVTELEGEEQWLRYHHLFRKFLRARLRRDPARFITTYSQAAQIYEQRSEWDKAIERYLALEDYERVAKIIASVGQRFFETGRLESLDNWLSALPRTILQAHLDLLLFQGKVHFERGDYISATKLFHQALREFTRVNDRVNVGLALVGMSTVSRLQAHYQEAIHQCHQALDLLQEGGSEAKPVIAEAHKNIGLSRLFLGDLPTGIAQLGKALGIYKQLYDTFNIANVLHDLGEAYRAAGQLDRALDHHEQALRYWRKLANPGAWSNTLNSLGVLYHLQGDYEQASQSLEAALAKARECGSPRREAYALASMGDLRRDQREYQKSLEAYTKAMKTAKSINDSRLITYLLDATGNLHRLMGNLYEAERLMQKALDHAEAIQSQSQIGICKTSLGILACERGNIPQAIEILSEAQKSLQELGFKREPARTHLHLGQVLFLSGEAEQGLEHVSQALSLIPTTARLHFLANEAVQMGSLLEYASSKGIEEPLIAEALSRIRTEAEKLKPTEISTTGTPLPSLRIYALGQPQVFLNSRPVTNASWITSTTKELFFCLLDSPEGLRKEQIGAIFWPEHSPEKLNGIFRSTMYRLRRALFSESVVYQDGIYSFNRQVNYWLDVEQFEEIPARAEALDEADEEAKTALLSQAVELYKGDYLEGFFSDWSLGRRENLRVKYISALTTLGDLYLEAQEYATALQSYNRILLNDPYQETAYRQAMRCYALMGDRAAAIRKYQECVEVLREELGLDPMPETKELYQQIID